MHVPRSVSPSVRLLAPLGCCEYHSCERRWTEISLGPWFQYSRVHTKILAYTATHLPPGGFRSRGLPTFPGAQRRKVVLYPAIPELLFRISSYLHPCARLSASAGTSFWRHLLWLCPSSPGSVKVVTNTVSPRGRATETDLRRVSPSPLARCSPYA